MQLWTDQCGAKVPYSGKYSHCPECHATFASHRVADLHRVGPYDQGRRCLTADEMRTATNGNGKPYEWRLLHHSWGDAWHDKLDPRWELPHSGIGDAQEGAPVSLPTPATVGAESAFTGVQG